jgi:hypothetical protein
MFQKAYNEVTKCKSTKLHGNGYLAKNPTRRQLPNAEREEQIRREELLHQEHVELMGAFGQLQKKCHHVKKKGKQKGENMHGNLKKVKREGRQICNSLGKSSYQCCKQQMDMHKFHRYWSSYLHE